VGTWCDHAELDFTGSVTVMTVGHTICGPEGRPCCVRRQEDGRVARRAKVAQGVGEQLRTRLEVGDVGYALSEVAGVTAEVLS